MDSDERPPALPDRLLAILRQEELWVDPPVDLEDRTLLHCGPAITWDEACDPLRRSLRAATVAEGWAADVAGA